MSIEPEQIVVGAHLVFAHPENGYPGEREDAAARLGVGEVCKVAHVEIDDARTKVWLVDKGVKPFNSVFFERFYLRSGLMPAQRPGTSEQAVGTPPRFLAAVRRLFSIFNFSVDLAADHTNAVCEVFLTKEVDALAPEVLWRVYCGAKGWGWLNPPFADIGPWVEKAWHESRLGARLMVLVPAATETHWWDDHVRGKAYVIYIKGRFAFVGHTSHYPKGLALLVYAPFLKGGDRVWAWTDDADR